MKTKIVFLGADGSGKSTLILYTEKKSKSEGKKVKTIFMGWTDFRNPLIKLFSRRHMENKARSKIKEEKLARFRDRSWFFYLVYYSELWIRYLDVMFSKADIVFMDRYFYDELVFASRAKFNFFKIFTPKPNICFILKPEYKITKKRGIDVTEDNFNRFYEQLYRVGNLCKVYEINTSGSVEQSYKKIAEVIKNNLGRKQ